MDPESPGKEPLTAGKARRFSVPANKMSKVMIKKNEATSTVVAKINNVEIVVVENGDKFVSIKPICDALGVDFQKQLERIKDDEILGQLYTIRYMVGADGKDREMGVLPFKFIFGWLFSINTKRVAPEAKDAVIRYKLDCYNALYNHFTRYAEFVEYQKEKIEEQLVIVEAINLNFNQAKNQLLEAKEELNRRRRLTFQEYQATRAQLQMFTTEEMGGM